MKLVYFHKIVFKTIKQRYLWLLIYRAKASENNGRNSCLSKVSNIL